MVGCQSLNDITITEDQDFIDNLLTPLTMLLGGMGWNPNNIFTYSIPIATPAFCEVIETYLVEITEDNVPFDPLVGTAPLFFDEACI